LNSICPLDAVVDDGTGALDGAVDGCPCPLDAVPVDGCICPLDAGVDDGTGAVDGCSCPLDAGAGDDGNTCPVGGLGEERSVSRKDIVMYFQS
jgi:hypothetical protein